jgi:hemerythrin-like metal-binding protein
MGRRASIRRAEEERILAEHSDLQQAARHFIAVARRQAAPAELAAHLGALQQQLDAHFAYEEELMQRTDYPERHAHHLLHEACLGQFRAEREQLLLGKSRSLAEYRQMMRTWIIDHLRGQDRRFEAFLAQFGS